MALRKICPLSYFILFLSLQACLGNSKLLRESVVEDTMALDPPRLSN